MMISIPVKQGRYSKYLKKSKINSGGTTITKSTEIEIIDCLKKENPARNDVHRSCQFYFRAGITLLCQTKSKC